MTVDRSVGASSALDGGDSSADLSARRRLRILVITNIVPWPLQGGNHLRIFNLLMRIARHHDVTLCAHSWGPEETVDAISLHGFGIRTFTAPHDTKLRRDRVVRMLRHAARRRPPSLAQSYSPALAGVISALIHRERFDIVQIEETVLAPYIDLIPRELVPLRILSLHDVHAVRAARFLNLPAGPLVRWWRRWNAHTMKRFEPQAAERFDRAITMSRDDRNSLASLSPSLPIEVVPNGVDTEALRLLDPPQGNPSLLFVGTMFYEPCEDAAIWMAREILPILRRRRPNIELQLVGRSPGPRVRELAGNGVVVTGSVPDVQPFYERAHVAVVPLRAGSGSRLKILEAMALGRPVVSTTIGAEGIEAEEGRDILRADDPASFAAAVERLLDDPALSKTLVANGRRLVETKYDWNLLAAHHLEIYDQLTRSRDR